MRNWIRSFFASFLALLVIFSSIPVAFAADSTIVVKSNNLFKYDVVSQYSATDLFDNFKNVMPGDKLTETVTITNRNVGADYIEVYLKAVPHDGTENPLTYSESYENLDGHDQTGLSGQRDETAATMSEFLSQLTMRVYCGKTLVFEGSPNETGKLENNIFLGKIRRLKSMELNVELEVPVTLDNSFANRVGEVDWQFTVEAHNDPKDNPKTGDYIIMGALALMILSGSILILLFVLRKKRRK